MRSKRKTITILIILLMTSLLPVYGEEIIWLTGVESAESWGYVGFSVNIYNWDTKELQKFDIPYEVSDVYFINGRYEDKPLMAIARENGIYIYSVDRDSIGAEICCIESNKELWIMSYYDGWIYAIEYYQNEEEYTCQRLVRFGPEEEFICDLFPAYDFMRPWDDRMIVSGNNHFARFENSEADEVGTIQMGLRVLINNGSTYTNKFISLFEMEYPYHQYTDQMYHTVAPALLWIDNENILCFLVRQEIDADFPGTSCNDAVIVNIHTGEVKPYIMDDGSVLVIKNRMLAGNPLLLDDYDELILQTNDVFILYPTEWWYSDIPIDIGSMSLADGRILQLVCYQGQETIERPVEKSVILCLD